MGAAGCAASAPAHEYLYNYYNTREAVRRHPLRAVHPGEFLRGQQERFYAEVAADPTDAWKAVERGREERETSYMAEVGSQRRRERAASDIAVGYQQVALELMRRCPAARAHDDHSRPHGSSVPGQPPDAVVEVPCVVGAHGVTPLATAPLPGLHARPATAGQGRRAGHHRGGRHRLRHPRPASVRPASLVDSVTVARNLLASYRARQPMLAAILR